MEEAKGKQNGSLVQARAYSGMINHGRDAKWQTSKELGLAHNGVRPSPSDIPRARAASGIEVWPSGILETMKPRKKMEPNHYDPGSEIFERTPLLGIRWQAQVKTQVHQAPVLNQMPCAPFSSGDQKVATSNIIAKGPPPLSRHPALLKNLNGHVSSASGLVAEYGRQVNSLQKPRHDLYNPAPNTRENLMIQSAKNQRSFIGDTFQSLLVNRQAPQVRNDVAIRQSKYTERHPISKSPLESQTQRGILRGRAPPDIIDLRSAEQHSYNSRTAGELQPIDLCKTRDLVDSQHPREEHDMDVTLIEPARSAAQCSTKMEAGEPSKCQRFLLIDNKGMPYTVLVEESKQSNQEEMESFEGGFGARGFGSGTEGLSTPRKMYSCPICSRVFEYLSYLQRHSITHSEQKPYVCDNCGKAFKRTSHLERHKFTHTVGKPYECQICQRSFRDTGELAHHHRVHTGERPYQCDMCHMRFGERNTLIRHVQRKHPKQPFPLESFTEYVSD